MYVNQVIGTALYKQVRFMYVCNTNVHTLQYSVYYNVLTLHTANTSDIQAFRESYTLNVYITILFPTAVICHADQTIGTRVSAVPKRLSRYVFPSHCSDIYVIEL